jgi:hypothetical protein
MVKRLSMLLDSLRNPKALFSVPNARSNGFCGHVDVKALKDLQLLVRGQRKPRRTFFYTAPQKMVGRKAEKKINAKLLGDFGNTLLRAPNVTIA